MLTITDLVLEVTGMPLCFQVIPDVAPLVEQFKVTLILPGRKIVL